MRFLFAMMAITLGAPLTVCAQNLQAPSEQQVRFRTAGGAFALQLPQLPNGPETIGPGQPPAAERTYTLAELEAIALANSPSLSRSAAQVQAARGQWLQTGLRPNPTAGYLGSEIGNEGRAGQQGAFVGQEFVRGGKLRLNRDIAQQEIRQAESRLEAQRLRVVNDVRLQYFNLLIAQRTVRMANRLVGISELSLQTAERLFKGEEAARVDVLQARIELNNTRMVLANAENEREASWRRLTAALAAPAMEPGSVQEDPYENRDRLQWSYAMQALLQTSPELAAANANVSRARAALARAEAEPIPNLDVTTSIQHDNASRDTIAGVQAGIAVPLWNRNQGGIQRAQAELAGAQSAVRQLELQVHNRLANAYVRYANAQQQVDRFAQEILPDAQTSLDIVTKAFQQGEIGFLVLLTSQRTYFQTNLSYLEALRQLRESQVLIEGMLLSDSLLSE